ncbi:MAG: hypothetical protein WCL06_06435 [Bacteroidota bacterium]
MKNIKILLASLLFLSLVACGPSKDAEEKEKRKQDSLMEIQRNAALNHAEQLLNDTTAAATDSVKTK